MALYDLSKTTVVLPRREGLAEDLEARACRALERWAGEAVTLTRDGNLTEVQWHDIAAAFRANGIDAAPHRENLEPDPKKPPRLGAVIGLMVVDEQLEGTHLVTWDPVACSLTLREMRIRIGWDNEAPADP